MFDFFNRKKLKRAKENEQIWHDAYIKEVEKRMQEIKRRKKLMAEYERRNDFKMTINEYQVQAMRFANPKCLNIFNAALGLTGEAGEFADLIKKINFHGHAKDTEHLIKELGDVLWYVALAAQILNTDLETIMEKNIDKLLARYPDGFSEERSKNRAKGDI